VGILTATQMCDEIRLALGQKTVADWPNVDRCERRLNESLLHLTSPRVYRHKELVLTDTSTLLVNSGNTYTISPITGVRMRALDSIVLVNPADRYDRWKLEPISEREGHETHDKRSDGKPFWYSMIDANSVELFPAPSNQYAGYTMSVRRIVYPTRFDLTNSPNAVSQLAEDWDEVLILGAVWRSWRTLKEWKLAEVTKAECGQLINEIADRMTLEAEDFRYPVDLYNPGYQ